MLIFKVFFVISILKIALTSLPFIRFKRLFSRFIQANSTKVYTDKYIEQLVWSVKAISHYLPFGFNCLPQALTTIYFLREDKSFQLIIGVQKDKDNDNLLAHAWVEQNGNFVIGDTPLINYIPIWKWK